MSDKPSHPQPVRFCLPEQAVVSLHGADAATFAQAQFMNDVAALPDRHWHWSGWLTPKGRVQALFALLKFDARTLWLLLPDGDAQTLADALQRFVFRSKVKLQVRDDLHVAGAFAAGSASAARFEGDAERGVQLDMSGDGGARSLWIGTEACAEDTDAVRRWQAFDLRHGLPRLPASQREHWTPQQLSLSRLQAYSVKKGCYPGQEIVARTHFLGQAKRGLVLLQGAAAPAAGSEVGNADGRLGEVACSGDGVALAVMADAAPGTALQADGQPMQVAALLDGLARRAEG